MDTNSTMNPESRARANGLDSICTVAVKPC